MYPGHRLFELQDSHGLPLVVAIDRIVDAGLSVDWIGYIEAARRHGWWDFQTWRVLQEALQDSMLTQPVRQAIGDGFKRYVLAVPHPAMREAV